ncbi:MAG: hypothetical protein JNK65_07810 [Deltaproteobacteria bacterium]|nr:hypothetical protein [Deltaproteobacteria bacterium]
MILPILAGIAAITLFSGCRREEASTQSSEPQPSTTPYQPPAIVTFPIPSSLRPTPTVAQLDVSRCDPNQAVPDRFALRNTREEFCKLHDLLFGQTCSITQNRIQISGPRNNSQSLLSLFGDLERSHQYQTIMQNENFRNRLSQLDGVRMYLSAGNACSFDSEGDMNNLISAYTLLEASRRDAQQSSGFEAGQVGCILRRGSFTLEGSHSHRDSLSGVQIQHLETDRHEEIITPATLREHPQLQANGLQVSGCQILGR